MDLSNDRQRKMLFLGIVAGLVALGLWLVWPRPDTTPEPKKTNLPSIAAPTGQAGPATPATPIPGITATVSPDSFDIYRLLPFAKKDFATAASIAQQFTALYGTYRYDEAPGAYLARLGPYVLPDVLNGLKVSDSAPGVVEDRAEKKTVAVGTASLTRVRDIGDTSIIFEVTGIQQITEAGVEKQDSNPLAVTVQKDGGSWRVYSFAPADEGQAGDDQP